MTRTKIRFAAVLLSLTAFIVLIVFLAGTMAMRYLYPLKYSDAVEKYSVEYNVDKALLYGVIHTESGFNPNAVSSSNAQGLMQLLPDTFSWLQTKTGEELPPEDIFDPETNIRYGTVFIKMLSEQFGGETETMIAAYHAGNNRVAKWLEDKNYSDDGRTLKNIPIPETSHYVKKVTRAMKIYKNLYSIK